MASSQKTGIDKEKEILKKEFDKLKEELRGLTEERQGVLRRINRLEGELVDIGIGSNISSLMSKLRLKANSALDFLDSTTGHDPAWIKVQVERFHIFLEKNFSRFEIQPMGPLYKCVAAQDEIWHPLVEKILTPFFFLYVVDNKEDEAVFKEVLDLFNADIVHHDPFDPSYEIQVMVQDYLIRFEPDPDLDRQLTKFSFPYVSLLKAVTFNGGVTGWMNVRVDDIWKNILVKKVKAESTFFFLTEHDAFIYMHAHARRNTLPPVTVFSLDGYQIYPFPEFKTSTFKLPNKCFFIIVDKKEEIKPIRALLVELQELEKLYDTAIEEEREKQFAILEKWDNLEKDANNNLKTEEDCDIEIPSLSPLHITV